MSYQEINAYNSPNVTPAASVAATFGTPRNVKSITIHWWGDPAQKPTFEGVIQWLCRPNGGSSAHVVVEAGRAAWIVNGVDAAWHAGNAYGNATSIGIECNPRAWDGDYQTVGEVVRDIRRIYGDLPLVPHRDWCLTQCPGVYDLARIDRIARSGSSAPAKPAPKPAPAKPAKPAMYDSGLKWIVEPGNGAWGIANYYGINFEALKRFNGLKTNRLRVGQVLRIPGPLVWEVQAGDKINTLNGIAKYYAVSRDWINSRNAWARGIGGDTPLKIGRVITIA